MKRPILTAILLCAVLAASVATALTVTLTGPLTYADPQWRSLAISNKPVDANGAFVAGGQYSATMEVCPSTSNPAAPGACSIATWTGASLTSGLQTVITYMIVNVWKPAHPDF